MTEYNLRYSLVLGNICLIKSTLFEIFEIWWITRLKKMRREYLRTRLYQTSDVKDPASYGFSEFSNDLNVPPHISPSFFLKFFL